MNSLLFLLLLRTASRLCSMPTLVPTLQTMAATHDVSVLLQLLLPHLVTRVYCQGQRSRCCCSSSSSSSFHLSSSYSSFSSLPFFFFISPPPPPRSLIIVSMCCPVSGEKEAEPGDKEAESDSEEADLAVFESLLKSVPLTNGLDRTVAR